MSKGLKALRRIDNHLIRHDETQRKEFDEYVSIIEKELKTLEFIKYKQVNISALFELDNLHQYNNYCNMVGGCKKLTREQYGLLKEYLNNDN